MQHLQVESHWSALSTWNSISIFLFDCISLLMVVPILCNRSGKYHKSLSLRTSLSTDLMAGNKCYLMIGAQYQCIISLHSMSNPTVLLANLQVDIFKRSFYCFPSFSRNFNSWDTVTRPTFIVCKHWWKMYHCLFEVNDISSASVSRESNHGRISVLTVPRTLKLSTVEKSVIRRERMCV